MSGGDMGARIQALDWSRTPLGSQEGWSAALRTTVHLMLASPLPTAFYWGAEFVLLYNDSRVPLLGGKHPSALGRPARLGFPDGWEGLHPLLERVMGLGVTVSAERRPCVLARQDFLEETCFTFSYLPVRDEHGLVIGVLELASDVTCQVLAERRSRLVRELALQTAPARDFRSVLHEVREVLVRSGPDVPFALLYTVEETGEETGTEDAARLVLRAGLEADRVPELLALGDATSPWPLAEVLCTGQPRLVEELDLGGGALHAGPWPEPVRRALLLPLALGADGAWDAVLVAGLSPRLPLEEGYRDFLQSLARQVAADGVRVRALREAERKEGPGPGAGQVWARPGAEALAQRLRESEERLRRVMDAAEVGLWEMDAATGHIATDGHALALMGLPSGVLFSLESGLQNVLVEDREPIARTLAAALAGENGGRYHMVFRTSREGDAPQRWVESRGQRLLGADGQSLGVGGILMDVTARKETEFLLSRQSRHNSLVAQVGLALSREGSVREMLQACAQTLTSHLGAAFVRIWLLEPTQNVLVLNASAGLHTALEGPHARIPVGRYEVGLIAEDKQPYLSNEVLGDPREYGEEELAPVPQREGDVTFAGYPLLVGERLVGVVALFARQSLAQDMLDFLEQVATSIALGVERLRAEIELRIRVDFEQQLIGIVSHDLRNPLSAIQLGASLLARRGELDERSAKSLSRIQSSAERATRMVKDLLDFTQQRLGGGIRIERRPADLHEVTRGVLDEVEAAYPTRELEARHEGEGRGAWDADRMAQVVQNLVTNALKYSPEDSLVRVSTHGDEKEFSLSVGNTGAPISPEMLASIFEPLRRGTEEVDKTGRSVGLGLYIVKSIVDAHGGQISVTSTRAEGTVFTVRLPRHGP